MLGANLFHKFFQVTVPMLKHVLLLATLYIFGHGMVTLGAVIFLVNTDHNLASVAIFENAESGRYGLACSISVVILVMTTIWLIERRSPTWARISAAGR